MSTEWVPVVKQTTAETRDALKRASAFHLPNRPSDRGMKPDEIKRAFWKPFLDASGSILAELDRVAAEADTGFQTVDEGVAVLIGELDGHSANLKTHEGRLDGHDTALTAHKERLVTHEGRIGGHEESIADHEERISAHEEHFETHDTTIRAHGNAIGANKLAIIGLRAQVEGIGRSYVMESFIHDLLFFMQGVKPITIYENRDGSGEAEAIEVYAEDLKTGDNILLIQKDVPDFWFEKTSSVKYAETYEHAGVEQELICHDADGNVVGLLHKAETDYNVIAGHATSAAASATDATAAAAQAAADRAEVETMIASIFTLQKAPALADLNDAIILPTPTLAML